MAHRMGRRFDLGARHGGHDIPFEVFGIAIDRQVQYRPELGFQRCKTAGIRDTGSEVMAVRARPTQDDGKRIRPTHLDQRSDVLRGQGRQNGLAGRLHRLTGRRIIQGFEAGRRTRLQGEAAQQVFTEGMDRLDLETTGRFKRLGEEFAGLVRLAGLEVAAEQILQFTRQHHVRRDRPVPEPLEQALLHLGRGSLGIGDAENGLGLVVVEQEIDDAVDQDTGLAGTRIGLDKDAGFRPRSALLGLARRLSDVRIEAGPAHSLPSGFSPAADAHSPRRAR